MGAITREWPVFHVLTFKNKIYVYPLSTIYLRNLLQK